MSKIFFQFRKIVILILLMHIFLISYSQIEIIQSNCQYALNEIQFIDNVGYIVGDNGTILKSINKGNTWSDISINAYIVTKKNQKDERINLTALYFINDNKGFIVGETKLIKTTDGGKTWVEVEGVKWVEAEGTIGEDIYFPTDKIGYLSKGLKFGESYSYKTNDGGDSWEKFTCPNDRMTSVYFFDENIGYMGGIEGQIYITETAGRLWKKLGVVTSLFPISAIYFKKAYEGFVLNNRTGVASVLDGEKGTTWCLDTITKLNKYRIKWIEQGEFMHEYKDMNFLNNKIGYAVGARQLHYKSGGRKLGILVTGDGGKSWFPLSNDKNEIIFNAVSKSGIVVGERGTILKIDIEYILNKDYEIQLLLKK